MAEIGKSLGGFTTHLADPRDSTSSLCGTVKGNLRIEPSSTRVGCKRCRVLDGRSHLR